MACVPGGSIVQSNGPTYSHDSNPTISKYLSEHSTTYKDLMVLKLQGWENPTGDKHFTEQRALANNLTTSLHKTLYNTMQQILQEIHDATGVFNLSEERPAILDLCMAPGGWTRQTLDHIPNARVTGVTLSTTVGGYEKLISESENLKVLFYDITMLASELGFTDADVPIDHPDKHLFEFKEVIPKSQLFDLVFCGGQVLRTHTRSAYREQGEARRLACSQLIIALQHMKPKGTLVMLLHKVDAWDTIQLLYVMNKCADIQLFKSGTKYTIRGSFYLIAKNIDPNNPALLSAITKWKSWWAACTRLLSDAERNLILQERFKGDESESEILAKFGPKLVQLGNPIWEIQRVALSRASFTKHQPSQE